MATEADVRKIALSLPETTEKPSYGTPGFRVKDKLFLRIRTEAEGGLVVFVADLGEKEALLAVGPEEVLHHAALRRLRDGAREPPGGRRQGAPRAHHRVVAERAPKKLLQQFDGE